jgi:hypothetical protein
LRLAPWLAGATAFVLYALTAAPSIAALFDDSLEFQLVLPTFGIAHPTGYPLYTLLGGLWSRLLWPFGAWAWRVNLLSALAAAVTVGLVFALAQRLASGGEEAAARSPRPIHQSSCSPHAACGLPEHSPSSPRTRRAGYAAVVAGSAAALVFALGPVWTAQATLAEVYALHNLLLAALLLVTVQIGAQASSSAAQGEQTRTSALQWRVALLALLVGLGLAHHRTIALALPGVAVYLLWSVPGIWRPRRAWLLWLAALLLPLLLYLYLPLRAAMGAADLHGSYTNTWAGFWEHVLARGYGGFFAPSALSVERSAGQWLALALAQVGWIGGALAVLGCAGLLDRRRRKEWVLVLLVLVVNLLFALAYRVADQEVFLLPVFLCLSLLAGNGAAVVATALRRHPHEGVRTEHERAEQGAPHEGVRTERDAIHPLTRSPAHPLIVFLLLLLLVWNPGRGAPVNRSGDWAVHDYAVDMAKVAFPPGAVVLGLEGEVTALKYMQAAEGLGTNAAPVAADDPARRAALLAEAVAGGAPAYLTRDLEGIATAYSFSGEGPLVRAWPRGTAQVGAPQHALGLAMAGGDLRLEGYDLQRLEWAGGPALRLNLYWRPTAAPAQTFKTSIRLLGADGAPLTYTDGAPAVFDQFPLRQVAPTNTWLPGELVRDAYAFYLPPGAEGGTLQVILYDAETLAEAGRWEAAIGAPLSEP